jgi:ferric-dicitrate binding protein FerR (iron transport regulator)
MDKSVNKNILFESFSGRATPLQKKLIEQWLLNPQNRELYYEWLDEWENQFIQIVPNTEEALQKSLQKIAQNEAYLTPISIEPTPNFFQPHFRWLAAAAIVLLISFGVFITRDYIFYQRYQTAFGEIQKIQLPDGSQVSLNANSSLKVARFGFGKNTREVFLMGEASFSVKHTIDNQRFIVKTDKNFEVEVLGTEFNVYARQKEAKVVLNKGKVKLNYSVGKNAKQLTMKPGDLVTFDPIGQVKVQQIEQPQNYSAWQEHRFVFEQTPLKEVATMIQENFGVKIEFRDEALSQRTISGAFHAENADELLQVISELLEINFNRQDNNVTFFE